VQQQQPVGRLRWARLQRPELQQPLRVLVSAQLLLVLQQPKRALEPAKKRREEEWQPVREQPPQQELGVQG
jgi:hypothetical protein